MVAELDGRVIRRCKVLPVPTDYHDVMEAVRQAHIVNDLVVLDRGGVGDPLMDLLVPECPRLVGARIIAGDKVKVVGREITVGKAALVGVVRAALSSGRVKAELPPSEEQGLKAELARFVTKPGRLKAGHVRFEAAGSGYDDRVMAVGLALLGRGLYDSGQLSVVERCGGCGDAA